MSSVRRLVTGVLVLLAMWVPGVMAAAPASAHADLVSTTPGDGELVTAPPKQVTMTFSEPVEAGLATVRFFDPYGDQAPVPRVINADGRPDTIVVPMPGQTFIGTYTVSWRVVSRDSHPVSGAFTFHVGSETSTGPARPPKVADEGSTTVNALYGVIRLLAFAALAVLVGAAFFLAAWWPGGGQYPAMVRLVWSAWGVLLLATIGVLLLFGPQATGRPLSSAVDSGLLSATMSTPLGTALLVRVLVLSVVAPGLALLLTRRGTPTPGQSALRIAAVLGGSVVLAATWSVAGHSAVGSQVAIAVPVDVTHLTAMGVWLGGLVALFGVLLRTKEIAVMRTAVPAFSRAALVCVAVLVLTGLYQGWRQVGSPTALVSTSYGWLLLGKVGLVLLLVALGAASRSWVRRHYDVADPVASSRAARRRTERVPGQRELLRFRRMVTAEAGLAVIVLAVTAVLVTSQPARTEQIQAAAQKATGQRLQAAQREAVQNRSEQSWVGGNSGPEPVGTRIGFDAGGPGERGSVDLVVFPATVGANEIHLSVLNPVGALMAVPEVTATLSLPDRALGPLPVHLQQLAPGHYTGTMTIPMAGRWQLAVAVRTSEVDQDTVRTPLDVR